MAALGDRVISAGGGDNHAKYTDAEAIAAVEGEATLDLTGDVDVATGKTLSADGLKFPATQVASADANTIDDYEQGTFTPEIADLSLDGSGEGQVHNIQVGRYTKIGNRVFFSLMVRATDLGSLTASEAANIVGLPFVSTSVANSTHGATWGQATSLAITAGQAGAAQVVTNATYIALRLWDVTSGSSVMLISELSASGVANISGVYEV